jgi:hypothetical protein
MARNIEVPLLHFLYCPAHVLLGFHSEVDSNLQELDKAEGVLNNNKGEMSEMDAEKIGWPI